MSVRVSGLLRRGFLSISLATLALASCSASAAPPSPGSDWVRVRTAHFTLYGDASPRKIEEVGLDLEKLRASLARLLRNATVNSPVPTTVYVFASDAEMTPYKPLWEGKPANVAGWFQS